MGLGHYLFFDQRFPTKVFADNGLLGWTNCFSKNLLEKAVALWRLVERTYLDRTIGESFI